MREQIEEHGARHVALVGATEADARNVIVEGPSGLVRISPPHFRPSYESSKRRLTWPNGAIATLYSAEEPDQLRGPQHDLAWCDEAAKWKNPIETWENLELGLRLGEHPRIVVTTTPRHVKLIHRLLADRMTVRTRGNTFENANLPPSYLARMRQQYDGTRLGRQELYAEVLEDLPGALWQQQQLEQSRRRTCPPLVRVVVAIDPAASASENADETGIVVAALGEDGDYYVLEDLSCRSSPHTWGQRAVNAYERHQADRIIAETNNGGDMVEEVIRTVSRQVTFKAVYASRGKVTRAEPIAALYEQGRVHHVGLFSELEDQMCSFVPGHSRAHPTGQTRWCGP